MQVRTMTVTTSGRGSRRFPVRSVVLVQPGEDGSVTRTTLSKRGGSKRKVSKRWRGLDKALRRMSLAQGTAADEYRRRHERSNSKKKNGALRDLGKNTVRSSRKGRKKLKLRFL